MRVPAPARERRVSRRLGRATLICRGERAMGRNGYIEIGIPFAIVAIECATAAWMGGDGLPPWLRLGLWIAAVASAGLALAGMATPRWPAMKLDDPTPRPTAPPDEPS